MKKLIPFLVVFAMLTGCAAQPTSTVVPTLAPTLTPTVFATWTPNPTPTPYPGTVVIPIEQMAKGIPWLPLDANAVPTTRFVYFNILKPPFDNVLVRKALAAATDREAAVAIAAKYNVRDPQPLTSITPPEVLGKDLYNQVGIPYDPVKAKAYFSEAGYGDASTFPAVTFLVALYPGGTNPAFNQKLAEGLVAMWKETLGIEVTVVAVSAARYRELRATDPEGIFLQGWQADVIDPDNFLRVMFHTNPEFDFGSNFSNKDFDRIVDQATTSANPARRQELYIEAEQILCEVEAAVIPLYYSH